MPELFSRYRQICYHEEYCNTDIHIPEISIVFTVDFKAKMHDIMLNNESLLKILHAYVR